MRCIKLKITVPGKISFYENLKCILYSHKILKKYNSFNFWFFDFYTELLHNIIGTNIFVYLVIYFSATNENVILFIWNVANILYYIL